MRELDQNYRATCTERMGSETILKWGQSCEFTTRNFSRREKELRRAAHFVTLVVRLADESRPARVAGEGGRGELSGRGADSSRPCTLGLVKVAKRRPRIKNNTSGLKAREE